MNASLKKAHGGWLEIGISWWWVAFCVGALYLVYSQAAREKVRSFDQLQGRLFELRVLRERLIAENEDLEMKLQSQSDPQWIELVLKRRLGLTGEGQTKVLFNRENESRVP